MRASENIACKISFRDAKPVCVVLDIVLDDFDVGTDKKRTKHGGFQVSNLKMTKTRACQWHFVVQF